jgi:hypothetical protein
MQGPWQWKRHMIIAGIATAALAGCGGSEDETDNGSGAAPVKQQTVISYATQFNRAQVKRLLAGGDHPNPADVAGQWKLIFNETLKLIDVKAPDLGGFTLLVVKQTEDALVVKDRDCADGNIELGMSRTDDSVTFTRDNDHCPQTVDLLVEQSWEKQEA